VFGLNATSKTFRNLLNGFQISLYRSIIKLAPQIKVEVAINNICINGEDLNPGVTYPSL